ncbi:MAG: transketolase family protein [Calditrichaeota bacterium]|nr:transketolase family protein [Calditrichota bacterium]MBT7787591.1 transketolase family protein [Calditrichota bacterium]
MSINYRNILPSTQWKNELTRHAYGETLVELGSTNERIIVMDADLAESTLTRYFRSAHPDRFIEMGIAEQNMIATAAGLSKTGFIPFLSSYAIFLTGRAWDQCRNTVDYARCNVKIAAAHGGISVGKDGPSHQSMEDLSNMLSLVNMTVVVPADQIETRKVTAWAAEYEGPVYYRLGREKVPTITTDESPFIHGKALEVVDGSDGTIIACGIMLSQAILAAELLAVDGIYPRVLNMATLKPIDVEAIHSAADETGAIVTAEEHSIYGGLGSIVARIVASSHWRVPVIPVSIENRYLTSGPPEDLLEIAGLTYIDIATALLKSLAMARGEFEVGGVRILPEMEKGDIRELKFGG